MPIKSTLLKTEGLLSISRSEIDPDNNITGTIIQALRHWVVMATEDEFKFDGYQIIRRATITSMEVSEREPFLGKVLKRSKRWRDATTNPSVHAESYLEILAELQEGERLVEFWTKGPDDKLESFDLGRIVSFSGSGTKIRVLDSQARWLDDVVHLPHKVLTKLWFDSASSRVYERFAPKD